MFARILLIVHCSHPAAAQFHQVFRPEGLWIGSHLHYTSLVTTSYFCGGSGHPNRQEIISEGDVLPARRRSQPAGQILKVGIAQGCAPSSQKPFGFRMRRICINEDIEMFLHERTQGEDLILHTADLFPHEYEKVTPPDADHIVMRIPI